MLALTSALTPLYCKHVFSARTINDVMYGCHGTSQSHHAYLGCIAWIHSAIINIPSGSALGYIDYCFVYSRYIPSHAGRHGVTITNIPASLSPSIVYLIGEDTDPCLQHLETGIYRRRREHIARGGTLVQSKAGVLLRMRASHLTVYWYHGYAMPPAPRY